MKDQSNQSADEDAGPMPEEELAGSLAEHAIWHEAKGTEGNEGTKADLTGTDLRGADLKGANLRRAILRDADLCYANLSGADLGRAVLTGADLWRTNLTALLCKGRSIVECRPVGSAFVAFRPPL